RGKIGVMWSNQNDSTVYFAYHPDGTPDNNWFSNPAVQGPRYADDHLNIKSLQADSSGQLFAIVKTSLNDVESSTSTKPLVLLLQLDAQGNWSRRTVWRIVDNVTRPIVLLDQQNRTIYAFTTVNYGSQDDGAIYYKSVSLDNPSMQFVEGRGTPFIVSSTDTHINNASSTKQALNSTTNLLVIAGDDRSDYYFHNKIVLGSGGVIPTASATNTIAPTHIPATSTPAPTFTSTPAPSPTLMTTPPGKTSLIAPTGSIGSTTPTYRWNHVSGSTWYYLWISRVNSDHSLTTMHNQWYESSAVCGGTTCSFAPSVTLSNGTYRWWVQSWNGAGYGPWSDDMNFTVSLPLPGKATLVSPAGNIGTRGPTYTWNEDSSATWYYLWVNGPSGNVIKQWYTAEQANCNGAFCSVTPTTLLSPGAHGWWIQTWNNAGYGPWSERMDFSSP
ncbi:MAG TPA: hypothetical protein VK900_07250, partial [Anaerolineales bacterium]|nr:hypothetical protein [Anaerolineales bacterium]